jgi:hypothetical protein
MIDVEEVIKEALDDTEAVKLIKKERSKEKTSDLTKFYGISDIWYIQRAITPKSQYQYAYVLLDTNNVAPELSGKTTFGWRVLNYLTQQAGTVSVCNNIRDLVGMRIFPVTSQLITPVGETGKIYTNNNINMNNNFTILIHEFQAQSFIGREGRRFHFSLFPQIMNFNYTISDVGVIPQNPYIEFTVSGKCNGWFWFKTPITEFSTMTISIGNPFDLVQPGANNTRTLIPLQLIYLAEKE